MVLVAVPASAEETKRVYSDAELESMPQPGPNPWLAYLPVGAEVDWNYWKQKRAFEARKRAAAQAESRKGAAAVAEVEPNNSLAGAQVIASFGTGNGDDDAVQISGSIAAAPAATPFVQNAEDNGDIGSATATGLTSGQVGSSSGTIGDGPHGSGGSGSADFDFFSVTGVSIGDTLSLTVTTGDPFGDLDPNCAIWDSAGTLLGFVEDSGGNFDCSVQVTTTSAGTFYFSIGGWKSGGQAVVLPGDPFDSSSGTGAASEGAYDVEIGFNSTDMDCYAVELEPGDMFGTAGTAPIATTSVFNHDDTLSQASSANNTAFYAPASPLPATGAVATDYVVYESGTHTVCVQGTTGAYTLDLGVARSVFEGTGNVQILFVDFDGATINPSIFGGPNEDRVISPLSSFLAGWGLAPGDEDAVIDSIMASLEESITADLALLNNPAFAVELRNSRDHADTFGQPNVSRLIVGGTIAELGISTIGIAQFIDPGNFGTEDSAITLLDLLSAPGGDPNSLNQFGLGGGATQIDLVGTGVGNITAHEAGHYLGNWHTENTAPSAPSIMDRGGNLANSVGVGPDGDFGTGDDIDVDFTTDDFAAAEGYGGVEQTGQKTAFGLTGALFFDGFETNDFSAWTTVFPPVP